MKVYIAVGHGIQPDGTYDPGAASGSVTEQSSGDVIVREAARLCRLAGLEVLDESFTDDPNFVGTAAAANRWGADALVAVHHDWTGGLRAHGFWHPGSTEGERLCREIIAEMKAGGVTVDDRHVRERDLYVVRETAMPSTLIEVGRIGQPEIDTDAERLAMGRFIAQGIADYAGVSIPGGTTTPDTEEPAMALTEDDARVVRDAVHQAMFGRTNPESFAERVARIRVDTRASRDMLVALSSAVASIADQVEALAAGDPVSAGNAGDAVRQALADAGEALATLDDEIT